jgi:hypothetical protein
LHVHADRKDASNAKPNTDVQLELSADLSLVAEEIESK